MELREVASFLMNEFTSGMRAWIPWLLLAVVFVAANLLVFKLSSGGPVSKNIAMALVITFTIGYIILVDWLNRDD